MTKLAKLMSDEEGYWKKGTLPQRNCNPGDLRHGPRCHHDPGDPNGIGKYACPEDGWADFERQLRLYADRGMTLRQCINSYAPPNENNTSAYLNFVASHLGVSPDTPMIEVLKISEAD